MRILRALLGQNSEDVASLPLDRADVAGRLALARRLGGQVFVARVRIAVLPLSLFARAGPLDWEEREQVSVLFLDGVAFVEGFRVGGGRVAGVRDFDVDLFN